MAQSPRDRRLTQRLLRPLLGRLYRPRTLLLLAVLAGTLLAAPQVIRLTRQLREQPEYLVASREIRLTPPPPHVPATLLTDALKRAQLPDPFSKLTPDLPETLRTALADDPWIASVERVRVLRSGVELELTYRTPALAVETRRGRYLVSGEGVLLPSETALRIDVAAMPHLIGDRDAPVSPAGQRWRDSEVVAAAELAAMLQTADDGSEPMWDRCGFATLTARGPHQWEIATASGSVVYWGSHADLVTEPSNEQKRLRLAKLLKQQKLGDGAAPYEIDLTLWDMVAVRPMLLR